MRLGRLRVCPASPCLLCLVLCCMYGHGEWRMENGECRRARRGEAGWGGLM